MAAKWHYLGRGGQGERRPRGRRKTSGVDVEGEGAGCRGRSRAEGRDGTVMAAQGQLCRSPNGDITTIAHPGRVDSHLLLTAPAVPDSPHCPSLLRAMAISSSPSIPHRLPPVLTNSCLQPSRAPHNMRLPRQASTRRAVRRYLWEHPPFLHPLPGAP